MNKSWIAAAALALAACSPAPAPAPAVEPQDAFFTSLSALCGRSYEGRVVTNDERDADRAGQQLVMHVRDCSADEIRIPFNVGENRSRTWVITRAESGLRLKHDHRHEDGSEDVLTQYGGDTTSEGTAERQEFPADDFSKQLFTANEIPASADNIWAVEVHPSETFAYELRRQDRHFRVEFDLTQEVPTPMASWGQLPNEH
ncbi:hypothetical protein [Terricaulis sp.]|uniref:hypothetical protein n=1 Tax=Terricaulis sp. TaxID=2768686 RepID=UPI002AC3B207|nr:hypothetical protein [Terricaulis sp.]MDZ4689721.1 hypothetical protein [Terricaulis sp.]